VAIQKATHSYAKSVGYGKWISSDAHSSSTSTDAPSDWSQSVPVTPVHSEGGSDFETSGVHSIPPLAKEQDEMTEDQKRCFQHGKRKGSKAATRPSDSEVPAMITRSQSGSRFETSGSGGSRFDLPSKPAQPPRSQTPTMSDPPAPKPKKVTTRLPAPPENEHPMTTRGKAKTASRAGSLRPGVGGSGQTDT
jgi:hypothetical protein